MFIILIANKWLKSVSRSNTIKKGQPPVISGLRPYGGKAKSGQPRSVFLHLEEYLVIRLCEYENLSQHEAARVMDVSRPTLTRVFVPAAGMRGSMSLHNSTGMRCDRFVAVTSSGKTTLWRKKLLCDGYVSSNYCYRAEP